MSFRELPQTVPEDWDLGGLGDVRKTWRLPWCSRGKVGISPSAEHHSAVGTGGVGGVDVDENVKGNGG